VAEIAAQISIVAAAQINGIPTNVNSEFEEGTTAWDLVRVVVKSQAAQ
jgi:hypothetical protein